MKDIKKEDIFLILFSSILLSFPPFIISRIGFYFNRSLNYFAADILLVIAIISSVWAVKFIVEKLKNDNNINYIVAVLWAPFFFILHKVWEVLAPPRFSLPVALFNITSVLTLLYVTVYSILIIFFIIKHNTQRQEE